LILQLRLIISQLLRRSVTLQSKVVLLLVLQFLGVVMQSGIQRRQKIRSFRDLSLQLRLIISQLLRHSVTLQSKVVLLLVLQFLGVVIGQILSRPSPLIVAVLHRACRKRWTGGPMKPHG
jgi:uncharacterized membrane protein